MTDELLDLDEVAAWLKVSTHTAYRWRHEGKGPPVIKVGGGLRYRRSDVDRWLDENTVGGVDDRG